MSNTTQTVIHQNSLTGMKELKAGSVDLIFSDPPYNQGVVYDDSNKKSDLLSDRDYTKMMFNFIKESHRVLTPNGSLWLMISDEWVCEFGVMLKEAKFHRRNHIVLWEGFGVQTTRKFARCKRHLLYVVKNNKDFIFNADAVMEPSKRLTVYGDKRANPKGKIAEDVWCLTRVCGSFKERVDGVPTQVAVDLPLRVINVASNPGDLVLDGFSGSATTGVACLLANGGPRSYLGYDVNEDYVRIGQDRIDEKRKELSVCFVG